MLITALQRFRSRRHDGCARGLHECDAGVPVAGRLGPSLWSGRLKTDASGEACPHTRACRDTGRCQLAVVAIEFAIGAATGTKIAQFQPITMVE
jgi:hypothetical protein